MKQQHEKVTIDLGPNKIAVLTIQPFEGDISEDVVKIDYANILGEIITFPVVFNRIANMRAETENQMALAKLEFDVHEARLYKTHKDKLVAVEGKASDKTTEAAVLRDPAYAIEKKKYILAQRNFAYIDALYWSAQSKDRKLNVLAEKISPEEFEKDLLEGSINGVIVRMHKKAIKG
jgi:hypothetical protein